MDENGVKRCKVELDQLTAMTASHPCLVTLHATPTSTSEPPSKRVKVDVSSNVGSDNEKKSSNDLALRSDQNPVALGTSEIASTSCSGRSETATLDAGRVTQQQPEPLALSGTEHPIASLGATCSQPSTGEAPLKQEFASASASQCHTSKMSTSPANPVIPLGQEETKTGGLEDRLGQNSLSSCSSKDNVPPPQQPSVSSTSTSSVPSKASTSGTENAVPVHAGKTQLPPMGEASKQDGESSSQAETVDLSKSTSFHHLRHKYLGELEYMLREFQKLERQLLGAKTQNTEESAGSRERREKLHSFILHLEETIQQIISGCQVETECKSAASITMDASSAQTNDVLLEKGDEENVQKLEEHILANLLPVKVRLKRQLAAQQGAKHNPAGMPTVRGGMQPIASGHPQAKATFLRPDAPAERRPSQFGKSLDGEGSKLTKNLHGQTLGSNALLTGHDANQVDGGNSTTTSASGPGKQQTQTSIERPKILYAGMALGSDQIDSSVAAASNVHQLVIKNPVLLESASRRNLLSVPVPGQSSGQSVLVPENASSGSSIPATTKADIQEKPTPLASVLSAHAPPSNPKETIEQRATVTTQKGPAVQVRPTKAEPKPRHSQTSQDQVRSEVEPCALTPEARNAIICYEERRKLLKKRRKKKKKQPDQRKTHVGPGTSPQPDVVCSKRSKRTQSQRGPRNVEYMCALCNEIYNSTCDYNPWWALTQHDCPKCHKMQIPRIDISAPANAIEYHPALLAHADENSGGGGCHAPAAVMFVPPKQEASATGSDSESDLSDDDGILSDADDSLDFSESEQEDIASMSVGGKAENEKFGIEYEGPKLSEYHASNLLILILHASTCPGQHKSDNHDDVCRSTKWMMLHVRDCPGTTLTGDVCPFPWCRKVKHMLYHLVSCETPDKCQICSPLSTSNKMKRLKALNDFRLAKRRTLMSSARSDRCSSAAVPNEGAVITDSRLCSSNPPGQHAGLGVGMNNPQCGSGDGRALAESHNVFSQLAPAPHSGTADGVCNENVGTGTSLCPTFDPTDQAGGSTSEMDICFTCADTSSASLNPSMIKMAPDSGRMGADMVDGSSGTNAAPPSNGDSWGVTPGNKEVAALVHARTTNSSIEGENHLSQQLNKTDALYVEVKTPALAVFESSAGVVNNLTPESAAAIEAATRHDIGSSTTSSAVAGDDSAFKEAPNALGSLASAHGYLSHDMPMSDAIATSEVAEPASSLVISSSEAQVSHQYPLIVDASSQYDASEIQASSFNDIDAATSDRADDVSSSLARPSLAEVATPLQSEANATIRSANDSIPTMEKSSSSTVAELELIVNRGVDRDPDSERDPCNTSISRAGNDSDECEKISLDFKTESTTIRNNGVSQENLILRVQ